MHKALIQTTQRINTDIKGSIVMLMLINIDRTYNAMQISLTCDHPLYLNTLFTYLAKGYNKFFIQFWKQNTSLQLKSWISLTSMIAHVHNYFEQMQL